jgi:uncharacterized protein (DUF885 family)
MKSGSFEENNEEMFKKLLKLDPFTASSLGLHDPYDWQMPNGGFKRLDDLAKLLDAWRKKAHAAAKSEDLTIDQRIILDGLDLSADILDFSINDYPLWKMYPEGLESPGGMLFMMISREYAPLETRIDAISSRLDLLPQYLAQFRSRFKGARAVKVWTEVAIEACDQIPSFLKFIDVTARSNVPQSMMAELRKNIARVDGALGDHRDWLDQLLDNADTDFAMGRKRLAKLMKLRGFDQTPDEMLALGEKYMRELKNEREQVAQRISPGRGFEAAAKIVQADAPKTFEAALKATKDMMEKAKRFIIEHNLATVDERAILKVIETPAFLAPIIPYAAMFMSSKFDKVQEGVYVVTKPKDPKDLASHLNYGAIINTAVHEAYPGHFQQGVVSNSKHWMLQLPGGIEHVYAGAETVEGWAHYCEKMMYDHGFEKNDPAALEMLNGAIWRAYRIIADIKLAYGDASIEEMVAKAVNEVGMPRDASEVEVRRYSRSPGQALSYMIGRHIIISFREELERQLGKDFNEKLFHDLVAAYGYLPISLMKKAVKAQITA